MHDFFLDVEGAIAKLWANFYEKSNTLGESTCSIFFPWPTTYDFLAVFAEQEFVLQIAQPTPP